MPLPVDVVVPAWGRYVEHVPQALASARAAARHLVVTDAPLMGSVTGLDPAGPALTVVPRVGASPGEARNAGLSAATSEFVLFLDADDRLATGALVALVAAARRHPDALAVAGLFRRADGTTWPTRRQARLVTSPLGLPLLLTRNVLPTTATLLRRGALPPDLFPAVRSEDWAAAVRVRARGRVVVLPRVVLHYRSEVGSRSRSAISAPEIDASRAALLPALLAERGGSRAWTAVDRVAALRRRHDARALAQWASTRASGPGPLLSGAAPGG